ncbi:unnamed protein product, partial [marine sediment metagenome]
PEVAPLPSQQPSASDTLPQPDAVSTLPASQEVNPQEGEPPTDKTWISPGKVNVGNFYAGARAEWPLLIHNGSNGERTEGKVITTEAGETRVAIPLKGFPVQTDGGAFLVTSLTDNSLTPVSYSTIDHTLLVDGFRPNATTEIVVSYISKAQFSVYFREPDHLLEGFENAPFETHKWVIIADKTPLIMPQTTQEIMIALDIPEDYMRELPARWEFWIGVTDTSQEGMIQAELCSRWLIISRVDS